MFNKMKIQLPMHLFAPLQVQRWFQFITCMGEVFLSLLKFVRWFLRCRDERVSKWNVDIISYNIIRVPNPEAKTHTIPIKKQTRKTEITDLGFFESYQRKNEKIKKEMIYNNLLQQINTQHYSIVLEKLTQRFNLNLHQMQYQ